MSEIRIRELRASDLDAVARMERAVFSDPWSRDAFEQEVGGKSGGWSRVAMDLDTGEMLAYLVAWFVADEIHLANLAVVSSARRNGLARRLLDELEEEGLRRGARLSVLEVRRSNGPARSLYQRRGYHTLMIRRGYYQDNREDAFVMGKTLTPSDQGPDR